MPNWCHNRVVISHMEAQPIKELADIFQKNQPFATLVPQPDWENTPNDKGELPVVSDLGLEFDGKQDLRWYDWRLDNWGCKWDLNEGDVTVKLSEDKTILQMWFETPWGPPDKIKEHIDNMNDGFEIEWHWDEPGMGSAGYL